MKRYFLITLLLLSASLFCIAQDNTPVFLRDTSFTVYSAYQKIKHEFPQATPVKPLPADRFKEIRQVVYKTVNGRALHLDIFVPLREEPASRPAVLLIHGGGWRSGDQTMQEPMARRLAAAGYVAATAEYRLSNEALYPTGIHDLKEAVKFLRANFSLFGIDTTRIASLGASAGGTLACFLGTTGHLDNFDGPTAFPSVSARVQAMINLDGIIDFTDPAESAKDTDPARPSAGALWFGATFAQAPDKWREASAVNYISEQTPPTLYINSALPRFRAGKEVLFEKLNFYGTYSKSHLIENTPHPFWLFHPWFDEAADYVIHFLNTIFEE